MELSYIRPTDKNLGHTNIVMDNTIIGYFLQDRSKWRTVGKNWVLVLNCNSKKYFADKSIRFFSQRFFSNRIKLVEFLTTTIT